MKRKSIEYLSYEAVILARAYFRLDLNGFTHLRGLEGQLGSRSAINKIEYVDADLFLGIHPIRTGIRHTAEARAHLGFSLIDHCSYLLCRNLPFAMLRV